MTVRENQGPFEEGAGYVLASQSGHELTKYLALVLLFTIAQKSVSCLGKQLGTGGAQ